MKKIMNLAIVQFICAAAKLYAENYDINRQLMDNYLWPDRFGIW